MGGKTQEETEQLEGVDVSDMWVLKGDEFRRFLFPDAQIALNRMYHWGLASDEERELMQSVDPEDRRVPADSLAEKFDWVDDEGAQDDGQVPPQ